MRPTTTFSSESALRHLLKTIRKRQAEFFGHVIRKSELEKLVRPASWMARKGQVDREQALTSLKKRLDPAASENTIIQATASRDT